MNISLEESRARNDMVDVMRLCYSRKYICGVEGNFSIRLSDDHILTTPRGSCKARLTAQELVLTDLEGKPIDAYCNKPSTELAMHLTAYKMRLNVRAVVHAHPTAAVGFTVAGQSLGKCILPEVVCTLGTIPVAPYATPSTGEVSASIEDIIKEHDALVLDHHGALAVGSDIWDAYYKLETLEHHAQTLLIAQVLGNVDPLYSSQVKKLLDICGVYGLQKPAAAQALLTAEYSRPD